MPTFRPIFFNTLRGKIRSIFHAKGKFCRFTRQEMPGPGNNCLPEKRDSLQAMQSKGFARNRSIECAKIGKNKRKGDIDISPCSDICLGRFHSAIRQRIRHHGNIRLHPVACHPALNSWQGTSCRHHGKRNPRPSSSNLYCKLLASKDIHPLSTTYLIRSYKNNSLQPRLL